ncbi:MAG TPA: D-alanyl-D-alanine carboxypeptidase, partial [Chitinophagaceae bacterium]|nr:D-alanyl-D-alanine carboxypeptidase [Chitinophagaceae bacterium]
IGDSVSIVRTSPMQEFKMVCEVRTAAANTGDNAYLYFEPSSELIYVRGTIPCCVDSFTISGSVPNGGIYAAGALSEFLASNHIQSSAFSMTPAGNFASNKEVKNLYTHISPPLDSIIYWFNKKSINLYGEALVKTIAYEKQGFGRTDSGINIVKKFWKEKGLDENELNIYDGSGLSPLNRVTTHAQVEILRHAKSRQWFPYFYASLPEFNNMKMKSGTINDVKGFCGYHAAKDGKEYIFSFLVNNYNGKSSQLVTKMYKVLDKLK